MTSNVSALSCIVSNSHQAIHFVSSAPSKIPYGGFSPVRLQTRFRQRPPSRASQRPLIGRHCRYLVSRRFIRSRTFVQAASRTSDYDCRSSGPWLLGRLYCPARYFFCQKPRKRHCVKILVMHPHEAKNSSTCGADVLVSGSSETPRSSPNYPLDRQGDIPFPACDSLGVCRRVGEMERAM